MIIRIKDNIEMNVNRHIIELLFLSLSTVYSKSRYCDSVFFLPDLGPKSEFPLNFPIIAGKMSQSKSSRKKIVRYFFM